MDKNFEAEIESLKKKNKILTKQNKILKEAFEKSNELYLEECNNNKQFLQKMMEGGL